MNWLSIAIAAQIIIGSSAVFDKALLKKRSIEPWSYAFWFGMLGLFAVLLLPFGYQPTELSIIFIALFSGVLFLGASFLTFFSLEYLEASETLPLIGAISPVFTLWLSRIFLGTDLGVLEILGFSFLVASGLLLFLAEGVGARKRIFPLLVLASGLIAGYYVTSKIVFNETSFITGFFWIKMGGVGLVLLFLGWPALRRRIFFASSHAQTPQRLLYLSNRGYAAIGSLLASFAISLSEPALIDATQNLRYLAVFLLAWLLLRERFRGRVLFLKLAAAIFILVGLFWLSFGQYVRSLPAVDTNRPTAWGLTFSQKFSSELGLDWRENYLAILDELKPARLRLIAYWDEIEPEDNSFTFENLDWQIAEAGQRNIPVILAVGVKLPRWPECHEPEWAQNQKSDIKNQKALGYIEAVVNRYKENRTIVVWQVENEPFLPFGQCPVRSRESLGTEVSLVRSLDSQRPILVTDGGEFGLWAPVARFGDIFGTTMYRKAYPRFIGPIFGVIEYPFAPSYFRIKERLVRWWNAMPDQRFLVIELQGEPWEPQSLASLPPERLVRDFSPEYFRDTIEYAKAAGFEEYYLWGAEWWFYMKGKYDDDRYWELTKSLFRGEL